jgi:DNA-3-methyladenine glycosylase I
VADDSEEAGTFREVFAGFDPEAVAAFGEAKIDALLGDAGIIRHRGQDRSLHQQCRTRHRTARRRRTRRVPLVVQTGTDACPRTVAEIPTTGPESAALSKALKKKGFRFVGPTTMYALMEAVGMVDTHLLDSHRRGTSGVWSE